MTKISQYPQDATPVGSDYVLGNQASGPSTMRFLISSLLNFMWTLANIPAGATSPITRDNYTTLPFVVSGMVWTGNSYGANLLASMTAGVVFINGRFISIAAITSQAMTASKDNYIDVLDNGDGTGTVVYTTVTNNAASPALAANSVRIAIIQTATTLTAATSINQGQTTAIVPIASSIAYTVTDSIGNLICCRDPANRVIGYRQIIAGFTTAATSATQITGLTVPVIIPANRKVSLKIWSPNAVTATGAASINVTIWQGTVGGGTQLSLLATASGSTTQYSVVDVEAETQGTGATTFNGGLNTSNAADAATVAAASTYPCFLKVMLD